MRFEQFAQQVRPLGLFETSAILPFYDTPQQAQRQLSDWTRDNRLTQLRRGHYVLNEANPHPFVVANHLVAGSYVSLQMALSYYHLIPEYVVTITSITTGRPNQYQNNFGRFTYRHIHPKLFFGMRRWLLVDDEYTLIATPEKALLDLIYLRPQGDSPAYIESLRLQNLDILDIDQLHLFAKRSGKPKLQRAADNITKIAVREAMEYEVL